MRDLGHVMAVAAVAGILGIGCAGGATTEPGSTAPAGFPEQATLQVRSGHANTLRPVSYVTVDVKVDRPGAAAIHPTIPLMGGTIDLSLSGEMVTLNDLTVEIEDTVLPADLLPPTGLALRNVHVSLVGPASGVGKLQAGEILAKVPVDVDLSWSVGAADGQSFPLAPVRITGVELTLRLIPDATGETLTAQIVGVGSGVVFSWADLIEISNLVVDAAAGDSGPIE